MNMKTSLHFIGIWAASFAALTVATEAQVPHVISYQGRVRPAFSGLGVFQFALVDSGAANTYWSNDGTTGAGAVPTAIVEVPVSNGVYSVYLGHRVLTGMTNIPPSVFTNDSVYLRVWFSDGSVAPVLTTPDTRIVSVGYAMIAATVVDGSITEAKLADDAVTSRKMARGAIETSSLASGAVTTEKLADNAVTADKISAGSITGRELAEEINLGSADSGPGVLKVYSGEDAEGVATIKLDGSAGTIRVSESFQIGSTQALLSATSYGGRFRIYDDDVNEVVDLQVSSSGTPALSLEGGYIAVKQEDGDTGVTIEGDREGAPMIKIGKSDGTASIILDGEDSDGNGRIKTQVLEISGGMDLSESFHILTLNDASAPKPGMIVCIDAATPGHLLVSSKPYDRTVAGVMSGAGGVRPGMLMGQQGSPLNGKHPVALTGRVYCQADASNGPIQPGDLLTTSDTPGHAMKVTDHARAQGAIIGKAMSSLSDGAGLVLVLVSLQ